MTHIRTRKELRELYAAPNDRSLRKDIGRLDRHCRRFLELSPFFVLSTSNASGHADASPRGGAPGFVHVADDRTLVIPDHPGNNRLDNLENLIERPEVGLLFLIPGVDETLRINGAVEIRDDAELREAVATDGKLPKTVLLVRVREVFLHCAKALIRSRLWHPEARVDRSALPTLGEMLKDQLGRTGRAETQDEMLARYSKSLY